MRIKANRFSSLIVAATGLALSGIVQAQNILEEIIVTATKRPQSGQEVPISMEVATYEALKNLNVTEFKDLERVVPGLDFGGSRDPVSASVKIRGVGDDTFGGVTADSVVALVEGLPVTGPGSLYSSMYDIGRVEVLRGPQGTLFGRNAPAGAILVWAERPDLEGFGGFVDVTASSWNTVKIDGAVNVPLIDDTVALRVSGSWAETNGYTDNEFLNKDANDASVKSARVQLYWAASDSLDVNFYFARTDQTTGFWPGSYNDSNLLNVDPEAVVAYGGLLPDSNLDDYAVYSSLDSESTFESDTVRISLDWDFGSHTLTSITGYGGGDPSFFADPQSSPASSEIQGSNVDSRSYIQEIRIANNDIAKFEYILGLFYFNEDQDVNLFGRRTSSVNLAPIGAFVGGDLGQSISGLGRQSVIVGSSNNVANNRTEAYSVFGNVVYHFNEALDVSLGLRYDELELDSEIQGVVGIESDYSLSTALTELNGETVGLAGGLVESFVNLVGGLPSEASTNISNRESFGNVSYSLKLRYHFADNTLFYAGLDSSYREGGINQGLLDNDDPEIAALGRFDEEDTEAFELGMKGQFLENTLRLNIALYDQTFDDYQVSRGGRFKGLLPPGVNVIGLNAEEFVSKGVEASAFWLIDDNWDLSASFAVSDTEATKFTGDICRSDEGPDDQLLCDHSGEEVNPEPSYYANIQLGYSKPISDWGVDAIARLSASPRGSRDLKQDHPDDSVSADSYTLWDATFGVVSEDDQWRVTLWGKNLTDELYAITPGGIRTSRFDSSVESYFATVGAPRSFGLNAVYNF